MKGVYFFTNIAPHYRRKQWLSFLQLKNINFKFYFGNSGRSGIKQIDFKDDEFLIYKDKLNLVKNYWLNSKILIWQSQIINCCINEKISIAIFTSDMYCLSTWIGSIICKLRNIEVVFWGHGYYGDESKVKLFFRKLFYKIPNKHILYERRGKNLMIKNGIDPNLIHVIFNSVDCPHISDLKHKFLGLKKDLIFPFFKKPNIFTIVFIGRLTKVKNIDLLIESVNRINRNELICNLLIIGDGTEKEYLESLSSIGTTNNYIHFLGAIYDPVETSKYLFFSDLCVSPGNVGLTGIHSLSSGTPVATHNNFDRQMPEAEAIIDMYNGFFFVENDVDSLTSNILNWISTKSYDRHLVRNNCIEIIDTYYNLSYQTCVMKNIILDQKPYV